MKNIFIKESENPDLFKGVTISDQYEENVMNNLSNLKSMEEKSPKNQIISIDEEEKKESSSSNSKFIDRRKKNVILQIPQKKGISISAKLKANNLSLTHKQSVGRDLEILEEEDSANSLLDDKKKNHSENEISKLRIWGQQFKLKLQISKKLKRKGDFGLVGIKKEKVFYYFREKLFDEVERSYYNGNRWIFLCNDDLKFNINKKDDVEQQSANDLIKDDLDYKKTVVKFIQKP